MFSVLLEHTGFVLNIDTAYFIIQLCDVLTVCSSISILINTVTVTKMIKYKVMPHEEFSLFIRIRQNCLAES